VRTRRGPSKQRRDAYSDFYESLSGVAVVIHEHGVGPVSQGGEIPEPSFEMPFDYNRPTRRALQRLELYASERVAAAAKSAYASAWHWWNETRQGKHDEELDGPIEAYLRAAETLLAAIREDLNIT
jgi:hypothetical protein